MTKRLLTLLTLAIVLQGSTGVAKTNIVNPADFDVAGVRLGMTPEEARTALASSGFSIGSDSMADSWNARVATEAGKFVNTPKDNTRAVYATEAEGPEYQKVEVIYEITATGSRAKKVEYSRPGEQGSIIALAKAKYGEPTKAHLNFMRYCVEKKGCLDFAYSDSLGPSLYVYASFSGRSTVTLSQGSAADSRWKYAFESAVRTIAPKYGEANF